MTKQPPPDDLPEETPDPFGPMEEGETAMEISAEELYYHRMNYVLGLTEQQMALAHGRSLKDVGWDSQQRCGELFAKLLKGFLILVDP